MPHIMPVYSNVEGGVAPARGGLAKPCGHSCGQWPGRSHQVDADLGHIAHSRGQPARSPRWSPRTSTRLDLARSCAHCAAADAACHPPLMASSYLDLDQGFQPCRRHRLTGADGGRLVAAIRAQVQQTCGRALRWPPHSPDVRTYSPKLSPSTEPCNIFPALRFQEMT